MTENKGHVGKPAKSLRVGQSKLRVGRRKRSKSNLTGMEVLAMNTMANLHNSQLPGDLTPKKPPSPKIEPRVKFAEMASNKGRARRAKKNSRLPPGEKYKLRDEYDEVDLKDEFLQAAEVGDVPTIRRILTIYPDFCVDVTDILGRTPLRLAVGNDHEEVVEVLLEKSSSDNIYEALLQAISEDHEDTAEIILKHPRYEDMRRENKIIGQRDNFFNQPPGAFESQFSTDVTPIILAAQRNHFEIVQMLLMMGDTIPKPHRHQCICPDCKNKFSIDPLRLAKSRLEAYKGLASEAYISLSSKDPILTAFELREEMTKVSKEEKYFRAEYLEIARVLTNYPVKLLDRVKGNEELDVLLNHTTGATGDGYEKLTRLRLAIHYNEKKFVAHSSCQQKLINIWYEGAKEMERANLPKQAMLAFAFVLAYPFLALCYLLAPHSKVGRILRIPCLKFMAHTLSLLSFLCVIITYSALMGSYDINENRLSNTPKVYSIYERYRTNFTDCTNASHIFMSCTDPIIRDHDIGISELLMTLFLIGFLWNECRQIYSEGVEGYFDSMYNVMDTAMIMLYIASFAMRFWVKYKVSVAIDYFGEESGWITLIDQIRREERVDMRQPEKATTHYYWLQSDRYDWDPWDPYMMGEAAFAAGNVLTFGRMSYLLAASDELGPLQVSLARMIKDIVRFLVLFSVLVIAFIVGLQNLYWYYGSRYRAIVDLPVHRSTETNAGKSFGDPELTFRTVFWALFGMGDSDVVELGDFKNKLTESVGYIMYGTYNFTAVVVILNMLIAMMSESYETTKEDEDTEWKFARGQLFMDYIKEGTTLPPPLNLIPSPKSFYYLFRSIAITCKNCCHRDKYFVDEETEMPARYSKSGKRSVDPEMYINENGRPPKNANDSHIDTNDNLGIKTFQIQMANSTGKTGWDGMISNDDLDYQKVITRIVKRFILESQSAEDAAEGELDELRQDVSSFRYEVISNLRTQQVQRRDDARRVEQLDDQVDMMHIKIDALFKAILKKTPQKYQRQKGDRPGKDKDGDNASITSLFSNASAKTNDDIAQKTKHSSTPRVDAQGRRSISAPTAPLAEEEEGEEVPDDRSETAETPSPSKTGPLQSIGDTFLSMYNLYKKPTPALTRRGTEIITDKHGLSHTLDYNRPRSRKNTLLKRPQDGALTEGKEADKRPYHFPLGDGREIRSRKYQTDDDSSSYEDLVYADANPKQQPKQ